MITSAADLSALLQARELDRVDALLQSRDVMPEDPAITSALQEVDPDDIMQANTTRIQEATASSETLQELVTALQESSFLMAFQNAGRVARQGRVGRLMGAVQEQLDLTGDNGPFLEQFARVGVVGDSEFQADVLSNKKTTTII